MLNGKATVVLLTVRLIKNTWYKWVKSLGGRVKVELDLSKKATKAELKNTTGTDISKLDKKIDLASLKSNLI